MCNGIIIEHFNPHFDLEQLLNDSSTINLICNYQKIKNFDDKFECFLKKFGHKINTLVNYNPSNFDIRKFIHLMPNLEVLHSDFNAQDNHSETFLNDFQNYSVPLKKLSIVNGSRVGLKIFKIFNIEELEIEGNFLIDENFVEFFSCCKNLKKLKLSNFENYWMLLDFLQTNELESIKIFESKQCSDEVILNFLNTQRKLKSIEFNNISNEIVSFICDNFKNLQSLDIKIPENITSEIFQKINNLKSLKSLYLRKNNKDSNNIEDLCTFSLPNLEHFRYDRSTKYLVQCLALNCKKLKSLELSAYQHDYEKILKETLKSFNQLESLTIMAKGLLTNQTISEDFYLISHFNSNLKTLKISIELFDPFKLKQKITRDFPNLENYPADKQSRLFTLLCPDKYFKVYLSSEENINEKLKDCSVKFSTNEKINTVQAIRDGKKEIWIEPDRYFNEQQLKAILTTTRKLKEISIVPNANLGSNAILHYIAYLKSINENVTTLTFKEFFPLEMCHKIIEVFPYLKVLKLEILGMNSYFEKIKYLINNPNLEEFHLIIYDRDRKNSFENHFKNFKHFRTHFDFSKNILKKFKFVSKSFLPNQRIDENVLKNFLENQKMLREFKENRINDDRKKDGNVKYVYTYEASLR
ncbi:hypothetical protein PVAND_016748 [Polypedilum vanderplanki]|uniref:Uncharacterized protein n=1 Tax=Polypedilum vanderplanki TaxID=319348 RepID=A0A9J6BG15_POLVA|nr:hypothetical protein PVAND_016748 [Polypedilum vanderplanki]